MPLGGLVRSLFWFGLPAIATGCAQSPYLAQSQNQANIQQSLALEERSRQVEARAATLDHDNQELQTLLAQSRQESKLLEEQLVAVRDQLSTASGQLAQTREESQQYAKQTEQLVAATRRRGAVITANSSIKRTLASLNLPGLEVRPDGDVVRVELPADRLFAPGSTLLLPAGANLVDATAAEIGRAFPGQSIGVEGHTDNQPVRLTGGPQQLSISRAMAVYHELETRGRFQAGQLFVVGHAGNHPVVSNATGQGQQRNNRVELVIYPEKAGQ